MENTQRQYLKSLLPANELVQRAFDYAADAHESIDQRRKYSGQPYIVHPVAVALRVAALGGTAVMIASALLHDVVEDTPRTIEDIYENFGNEVGKMVAGLTDVSVLADGNRKTRKAMDAEHTRVQCADTHTVKLADIEHNFHDITVQDPGFAPRWVGEKVILVEYCADGHPELVAEVTKLVTDYMDRRRT